MSEIFNEYLKNLITVILIVFVTQTVFFIIYSYFVCGDAFLVLENFYAMTYNWSFR